MIKIIGRRTKHGRFIETEVELSSRIYTLDFIRQKFNSEPFSFKEYIEEFSYWNCTKKKIASEREQLKRLVKNNWLNMNKKTKRFSLSKKSRKYIEYWGYFANERGPLMKQKDFKQLEEPRAIKINHKIVENKFLGEI